MWPDGSWSWIGEKGSPGKGTILPGWSKNRIVSVNIYLPVTEEAVIEKPELPEEVFLGTDSILLVDDEEAIL